MPPSTHLGAGKLFSGAEKILQLLGNFFWGPKYFFLGQKQLQSLVEGPPDPFWPNWALFRAPTPHFLAQGVPLYRWLKTSASIAE